MSELAKVLLHVKKHEHFQGLIFRKINSLTNSRDDRREAPPNEKIDSLGQGEAFRAIRTSMLQATGQRTAQWQETMSAAVNHRSLVLLLP